MPDDVDFLGHLYDRFNVRDMDAALAAMHRDLLWATGLAGGLVHGRDGARDRWMRQWVMMVTRAEPTGFSTSEDGAACVGVHLTARDLERAVRRLGRV